MTQPNPSPRTPRQGSLAQPDPASAIPDPAPRTTFPNEWFNRMPNGGTVYQHPPMPVEWFRHAPTGGGTVYTRPEPVDEDEFAECLRVYPDTDTTGETR